MLKKLTKREKRTLILGFFAIVLIVGFGFAGPWFDEWSTIRAELDTRRQQVKTISPPTSDREKKAAEILERTVPVFKMPVNATQQAMLFRDTFNEQLKRAGIQVKTLQPIGEKSSKKVGTYKLLKLQCRGKCNLNQVLDLLADLNTNPYLAGIEDISIKCDQRDRRQMDLVLTVSSFAR